MPSSMHVARSFCTLPPERPHWVDATMFWTPHGGGVRRYLLAKREWLSRQALWQHTIVAPNADLEHMREVAAPLIPNSGGYRLPLSRRASARLIAQLKPTVIEAGDPYRLAWSALDAAQDVGVPALAFCHSNLERMALMWAGGAAGRTAAHVARRYARHLYSRFDLVLAPSESMRRHLLDWGVERVVRQPLGVDTQTFHPDRASLAWRASLGLPRDAVLLVAAGRFAREKNLQTLADAAALLGKRYVLLAVGSGPTPPRGPNVRLLPHRKRSADLATVLASADLFVHAGDQETFGLTALEAMACGTPAVVRDAEGLSEVVDERVGCAVRGSTPLAFAEAIATLARMPREAMSEAARKRAQTYAWKHVLPVLMNRCRALINAGPLTVTSAREAPHATWKHP